MICKQCGAVILDGLKNCNHCGAAVLSKFPPVISHSMPKNAQQIKVIDDVNGNETFQLMEGEIIVRQFNCNKIVGKFGQTKGDEFLVVTNKRIVNYGFYRTIFYNREYYYEIPVSLRTSVKLCCGHGVNKFLLLIATGIFIVSFALPLIWKFIAWIFCGILIWSAFSRRYNLWINVIGKVFDPIVVRSYRKKHLLSALIRFMTNNTDMDEPNESLSETNEIMKDLGAMLADIRENGDAAVARWQK